jgi:Carboxypeptidase regulatory-like domain
MRIVLRSVCLSFLTALAGLPLGADVLCIGTSTVTARKNVEQCRSDASINGIASNDTARAFVVIKPEGAAFILGEIPPRTTSWTAVQQQATVPVTVAITAAETIESLCALSLDPRSEDAEAAGRTPKWSIDLAAPATGERRLMLPAGQYNLVVDCKGFVPAEAIVNASAKPQPERVNLALLPVPRVHGRVITPEPAIALIHDQDDRLLGKTDPDGAFQISILPKEWPRSLSVSASGLGTVVVNIPPKAVSVELPDIELQKAGQVSIAGVPDILRQIESIEVLDLSDRHNKKPYLNVREETLRAKDYVIANLRPGRYLIVLAGSEPLERFGETVEVVAGQTATVQADWTAEEVEVRTFLGDDALGDAKLYMQSAKFLWNATFTTSSEGVRNIRLWQPGEFGYLLDGGEVSGYGGSVQLDGTRAEIRVPSRTIEGMVVDSATDEPLAGVHVLLSDGRGGRTATSGTDGTFRFGGVKPGLYRLAGGGERGISHEAIKVEVTEQMSNRQVRLELRRQPELEIELVTAQGTAASGATVAGNAVASLREANEAGLVRLPRVSASARSIVVLTPDGSLHAQSLPADENRGTLRVNIPRPTSAISILVESSGDHEPIAGVSLGMRFNGVLFPDLAMQLIADRAGLLLKSASNGRIRLTRVPGGTYEFWPVRSRSDIEAFITGQLGAAPIVLVAGPGENVAKLTFARVAPRAETP